LRSINGQGADLEIKVFDHVAGAREARGVAVVIDVFRAFSVAPHAFDCGANRVLPVAGIEDAHALRARYPNSLMAGERHTRPLPGFDAGNSPTEIRALDLRGRTLIHTTHAGTQGLVGATGADEVLTGSFVNISAVCAYLLEQAPAQVSLVRMGYEARERCAEDDLYAECLMDLLQGREAPLGEIRERLRHAPAAEKFFDPEMPWAPESDFIYCTEVDRFDFVLKLQRTTGQPLELAPFARREGAWTKQENISKDTPN
jgi:2-phosphosulfolactate phosphatase